MDADLLVLIGSILNWVKAEDVAAFLLEDLHFHFAEVFVEHIGWDAILIYEGLILCLLLVLLSGIILHLSTFSQEETRITVIILLLCISPSRGLSQIHIFKEFLLGTLCV